jgi:hypothetical protein
LISSKDFWLTKIDLKWNILGNKMERFNFKVTWQQVKRTENAYRR